MDGAMTSGLRFGAVIPTYNREALLPETLRSLRAQTRPFDAILVVDDGSTDATPALMKSEFPDIGYLRKGKENVQSARNAGVAALSVDWIILCDSDDLLAADYLATIEAAAMRTPALRAIYVNHSGFTTGGDVCFASKFDTAPRGYWDCAVEQEGMYVTGGDYGGFQSAVELCCNLVAFPTLWPTGMAIRRDYYESLNGFDVRMAGIRSEDFEFTLRVVASGCVGFLRQALAQVRYRDAAARIDGVRQYRGEIAVLQFCRAHHRAAQEPALQMAIDAAIISRSRHAVYKAFEQRNWQWCQELSAALEGHPITMRERLKFLVARLPAPIADLACNLLSRLGSMASATMPAHLPGA